MPERLCYSPQAQLDLDEIYDYFREVEGIVYVDRILSKRRDFALLLGETRRGH